ncbi:MauE/DoxX family redox-associated membrane protein [Pedobacter aquatilis]|uniref:MauE/DoxX family redox-associated membrane protein n=1 Tax=Pedobacter aquatilis TaxID=351343 RepID=UPI00292D2C41|nr:MauE/DoxX family redox-associated membrane protein [Pedobacter aquatilis]
MNSKEIQKISLRGIAFMLITLWIYVAVAKLINITAFKHALKKQPFPNGWAEQLAWLLPTFELFIALLLIFPKSLRYGLIASSTLLFIFTVYIVLILTGSFANSVPCACGGLITQFNWSQHLFFNTIILLMNLYGLYYHWQQRGGIN